MLFNLGPYESLLLVVVTTVLIGLPVMTWFLARREAKRRCRG